MIKEDEYKKVVARNLRNIMWQHQKTQAEVARDLKINKATLSAWMNGTRTPKMKNIDMLCEYFGVQRSALMEVDGERKTTKITSEQAELIQLPMSCRKSTAMPSMTSIWKCRKRQWGLSKNHYKTPKKIAPQSAFLSTLRG